MTWMESILIVMTVAGGVGLFIFGMELITTNLSRLLGPNLRLLLQRVTVNRAMGLIGGSAVATLLFSGPTTLMVVNFVNAGLISLAQGLPVIFGANIGTTLALQLIAFDLKPYALAALGVAMIIRIVTSSDALKTFTSALIGFAFIFLGLGLMQPALEPLANSQFVVRFLGQINSSTASGIMVGVLVSFVLSAVMMSSAAFIATIFAFSHAGLITSFDQVFPILLGAHIGACIITLIGSIGTNVHARRAAVAHLLFNILGGLLAIAMMRLYTHIIPLTSDNLVRQIANGNTMIQVVNGVLFLAVVGPFSRLVEWIIPMPAGQETERSHLDPSMVRTPELALLMVIREMRRQARICRRMLRVSMEAMLSLDIGRFSEVRRDESAVDEIKHALDNYFVIIGERRLSRRQSVLLQHLVASSNDLERIADHIETIGVLTRTKVKRKMWFEDQSMMRLVELSRLVAESLETTIDALDIAQPEAREKAQRVLALRKEYKRRAQEIKEEFNSRYFTGAEDAIHGMFFMRYVTVFDRIMRHVRAIARAELKETFRIKEPKLTLEAPRQKMIRTAPAGNRGGIDESALFVDADGD